MVVLKVSVAMTSAPAHCGAKSLSLYLVGGHADAALYVVGGHILSLQSGLQSEGFMFHCER